MRWHRLALLVVACGPTHGDGTTGAPTVDATTGVATGGEFTTGPSMPTTGAAETADEGTTGHTPTGTCVVAPQAHDACPDPCPLTVDVEITCDDPDFGVTGVRVAASPDIVWLATAGATGSFLHAAGPGETTRAELPAEFTHRPIVLATAPSGELHLAVGNGDIVHLSQADSKPAQIVNQRRLLDLEVDAAGVPHVWSFREPDGYFEAVRAADDTWTEVAALAPEMVVQTHFAFTQEGSTVGFGVRLGDGGFQLSSRVGDDSQDVGAPTALSEYRHAGGAAEGDPDVVFAHLHHDGLRVAWPGEPGVLLPETAPLEPMCPIELLNTTDCPFKCKDTAVGVERGAFMIARTGDGRGWLAHLTTHLDHQVTYTARVADVLGAYCDGDVDEDHDAGVLHLYELGFTGAQPTQRLAIPIATPAVDDLENFHYLVTDVDQRPLDLRAFGSSLAIGLRTRDSATGALAVRLLRFETGL